MTRPFSMRKFIQIMEDRLREIDLSALKDVPQHPQTQAVLNDQLRALRTIANKFGLYDAADYLRGVLNE